MKFELSPSPRKHWHHSRKKLCATSQVVLLSSSLLGTWPHVANGLKSFVALV